MESSRSSKAVRETSHELARAIWLDGEIRRGAYPSWRALEEEFGVSRRTALGTVAFLRDSLGAPLAYSRTHGGYFYTDPTYALPAVFLREGELLALLLAQQVSREYLGTALQPALRAVVAKLSRYLPDCVAVDLQGLADRFQFAGGSSLEVPLELATAVQAAVREQRVLRIVYYTASRDETRAREIEPHFLRNMRGDWTVVAWDRRQNDVREFMLARIREHETLEERFARQPGLTPQEYAAHTFQTEHGAEPYEVVLRFDSYQARWIRERTWHPSQRIEPAPDGGLVLRLTVAGEGDLLRWILGYGSHVRVIEPAWLRERVVETVRDMAAMYGIRARGSIDE